MPSFHALCRPDECVFGGPGLGNNSYMGMTLKMLTLCFPEQDVHCSIQYNGHSMNGHSKGLCNKTPWLCFIKHQDLSYNSYTTYTTYVQNFSYTFYMMSFHYITK